MIELIEILNEIKKDVDFNNEKNLIDNGILDSIDIVEIISKIEEHFNIEIEPDKIEPENFQSVETIWSLISSNIV